MEYKTCLLFIVSLALAITMIKANEKKCAEAGEHCVTGDACCSGSCMSFRARCAPSLGGLIIPEGFQQPAPLPPVAPFPNQQNCAGLGSPCHSRDCCAPLYCGNFGLSCKL